MSRERNCFTTTLFAAFLAVCIPLPTLAEDPIEFEEEIWPLLHERCHSCHGPKVQESGLRLDTKAAVKEAQTTAAIVPGKSTESELIRRVISTDPDATMPPQGQKLSPDEVRRLAHWIDAGAPWPDGFADKGKSDANSHWAWSPADDIETPSVKRPDILHHPIDGFVQERLEQEVRSLSPIANRRTLLRRVSYDLVGLPPSPEEMEAFLADSSEDAFERVVDRMLASPRYGERWGRHWMDLVRYSDTAGDNADYPVPEAYRYRDYIIDSFNEDKPYDEFVVEQLAGDILAGDGPEDEYAERIVATGYIALSRRYATAPFELMHLTIEDAIDTTGRTFLGLTLRCARCHDHKFDPVTMEDYYGLYGIFASTRFPYAGSEEFQSKQLPRTGFVPLLPPDRAAAQLEANEQELQRLQLEIDQRKTALAAEGIETEAKRRLESEIGTFEAERARLVRMGAPADLPVAYAVVDAAPVDQAIQQRGEPSEPGPVVPRRAPKFFAGEEPLAISGNRSGRLEFARWLVQEDNALTAKVMVNRIWQYHFGRGLVRTSSNFGALGEPPTHPKLLQWLTREFVDADWSIKAMHRQILSSTTWQQESAPNGSDDLLLGQFARRRLDAESIRDGVLYVAGSLDLSRPGRHPFPDIGDWHWTQHQPFKEVYPSSHRSVFLMRQRIQRHPFLALFDAPDANVSTDVRTTATVPQQALFLMNNPFVLEQSKAFANRVLSHSDDPSSRLAFAMNSTWSRTPTDQEQTAASSYIQRFVVAAQQDGLTAEQANIEAWSSYARVLLTSNEFFYLD